MSLPGWPIVAPVAGADGDGAERWISRVLASSTTSTSTPTLAQSCRATPRRPTPETDRRRSCRNRGTASCFVQRDDDGRRIDETAGDPPAGGGSPASPISGTMPGAAVRSPRAELHVAVIGAAPFFRRTADSPGAAGRSAGPPFRDRNGHEADDPSPKIGRHRAGRPCDRETISTSFAESAVNQGHRHRAAARDPMPDGSHHAATSRAAGIVEPFLRDPNCATVVGDQCGESRGAGG